MSPHLDPAGRELRLQLSAVLHQQALGRLRVMTLRVSATDLDPVGSGGRRPGRCVRCRAGGESPAVPGHPRDGLLPPCAGVRPGMSRVGASIPASVRPYRPACPRPEHGTSAVVRFPSPKAGGGKLLHRSAVRSAAFMAQCRVREVLAQLNDLPVMDAEARTQHSEWERLQGPRGRSWSLSARFPWSGVRGTV